jgi:SNF2 family DNA or RNA helicase
MIDISYKNNDHSVSISTDNHNQSWSEIRRVCEENSVEILVPSERHIILPWWSFLNSVNGINLIAKKYRMPISLDEEIKAHLINAQGNRKKFNEAKNSEPASLEFISDSLSEVEFKRTLTNEQLRNVSKIYPLAGGATFSVPGAGKTTEALALYFLKKQANTKLLIVAPKNAFSAWEEQIVKCVANPPTITRLRGGESNIISLIEQEPSICLITYSQFPRVVDTLAKYFSRYNFMMFLDESHRIKRGHDGVIGKSILRLAHLPSVKVIMSGTPMPNSPVDLVPQFNFLYPEIKVDDETVLSEIQNVYVRTTKNELKIPLYKITMTKVEMGPEQKKLYNLLKSEELRQLENISGNEIVKLRRMGNSVMRMLQVTSNPALLLKSQMDVDDNITSLITEAGSSKIDYVCNRVRLLASQGKKTIVWSSFVENIELLSQRLIDLGALYIHGQVDSGSEDDSDTREAKIKKFHEDENTFVLIANPAAAGEGISLHEVCHDAIYLDRNYNAAQYLQSIDRIHRLGLPPDQETNVEIVYCPNSIDESVDRRLSFKIENMARVLRDPSLSIEPEYSDEEVQLNSFNLKDASDFINHLRGQ